MSTAAVFPPRHDAGYGRSFALTFAIHSLLLGVLFLGVRLQSYTPESISVELWEPIPPPLPAPVAEPPKVEPEPPKVELRPEPKIEKPQIVEKAAPKPKPKPQPVKPKPVPRDLETEKRAREELALEQSEFRERQIKEQVAREQAALARAQAAARERAMAAWVSKIRNKIRSNINLPQDLAGNPEAIFDVALLPTGEVLTDQVKMRKSSGNKGYDDAVYRAILKSSPLPKPEPASLFERQLELRFRPLDQ